MNDASLRQNIIDELDFEPSLNAAHIGIVVEDGVVTVTGGKVTLDGDVHAWSERDIAEHAAWATPGVNVVEDRLRVT